MSIKSVNKRLFYSLIVSNFVSILLFAIRAVGTNNDRYWFLFWNLTLAWTPFIFAWILRDKLKKNGWREPYQIILTILWLGFLPNSFYIISDLIHLQSTAEVGVLYDSVLFMSIIWNALIAGMMSIFMVHKELAKRLPSDIVYALIGIIFALVSFAIYMGRILRWNTWDVLANPAGLIFDVSDHVINPLSHPQVFVTTASFFVLLCSMYLVIWNLVDMLTTRKR